MTEVFLGVDAGTSGIKVCAFTREGRLVAKAHRTVPVITPYPLWAEIDPERYWVATADAIREVAARVPSIVSIGLATTCPTTILLDEDGQAVRPGILYLDGRAQARLDEVVGPDSAAYMQQTGNRASTSTCWAANLTWIREHEPAGWARARRITMLNGFLARRLGGRDGIEPTQASYSGLMRIGDSEPRWNHDLLALWGLEATILPEISTCTDMICRVTDGASALTGIPAGTPVALGAADTAAASFAVGLMNSGEVFESVGTSGVITFCLDRPDFEPSFLHRQHIVPGRWLAHGAMSTLGGAFGWLNNKVWPELKTLAELEHLAQESVPGANGLLFLPYLAGERSPIWDAEASGSWLGLLLRHSRQDMVRAVFEGTTFGLRQILERGSAKWSKRPEHMLSVGGGARNRFWGQMKADVLKLDYIMSDMPDAAALGAGLLGAIAAGLFTGSQDAELPLISANATAIRPGSQRTIEIYDRMFRIFDAAYPQMRDLMHALADRSSGQYADEGSRRHLAARATG
ncbi:xylulokinase [Microvirga vignae]|uniref:xylulokinase n=1 Tax=Microvirga vignae TaxID=1225564 RepID=UPI0006999A8D|nr:FGGY family carbohydrate kinase [Microvirga vignae]